MLATRHYRQRSTIIFCYLTQFNILTVSFYNTLHSLCVSCRCQVYRTNKTIKYTNAVISVLYYPHSKMYKAAGNLDSSNYKVNVYNRSLRFPCILILWTIHFINTFQFISSRAKITQSALIAASLTCGIVGVDRFYGGFLRRHLRPDTKKRLSHHNKCAGCPHWCGRGSEGRELATIRLFLSVTAPIIVSRILRASQYEWRNTATF